jgi:DoxX-like family
MFATYVVVAAVAAAANGSAAGADFARSSWILGNMARYGVPRSWLYPLGAAKALGALGLLVGIAVPPIGMAAAAGLVLFFAGAIVTVLRAKVYSHIVYPTTFLLLAAGALVLRLASA